MNDVALEQELENAIVRLKAEMARRQTTDRPVSSCVMRAYQATLERHYARLDRLRDTLTETAPEARTRRLA